MRALIAALLPLVLSGAAADTQMRQALLVKTGVVELAPGDVEIGRELTLPVDSHDLTIRGAKAGTVIRASAAFRGRALLVIPTGKNIRIENLTLDGNRDAVAKPMGLPSSDTTFARFTPNSGILAEGVSQLEIAGVKAARIAGFAILVSASHQVRIHDVEVTESGGLNARSRNNTTGGILLEEGTTDFEITHCRFNNVLGNGIWTHSLYRSERNARGRIAGNDFAMIARDAIQVGHATSITVENNRGTMIGFPAERVDLEGRAFPVAIDTAGNVDQSVYRNNRFEEIDGKCIDLDGFHDGEVTGNTCTNDQTLDKYPYGNFGIIMNNTNPDMRSRNVQITGNTLDGTVFGGIFVIGTENVVRDNHLTRINMAHCNESTAFNCLYAKDQPDLLRTGIYLGRGAERPDPARGNVVEGNEISGFGMSRQCIAAAPGVSLDANRILKNECSDEASIARLETPR